MTSSSLTQLLDRHVRGRQARRRGGRRGEIDPVGHATTVLLTAVSLESPAPPVVMRDFWTHTAHVRS